jgi:hypothetical protein
MGPLQDAVHKTVGKLPQLILSRLVKEKLTSQKLDLSKEQLNALVTQILNGKVGTASIVLEDDGPDRSINLEFTDDDAETIRRRGDRFIESLPKLIGRVVSETATKVLALLKERWPQEAIQQQEEIGEFRKRLHQRWGVGLD